MHGETVKLKSPTPPYMKFCISTSSAWIFTAYPNIWCYLARDCQQKAFTACRICWFN